MALWNTSRNRPLLNSPRLPFTICRSFGNTCDPRIRLFLPFQSKTRWPRTPPRSGPTCSDSDVSTYYQSAAHDRTETVVSVRHLWFPVLASHARKTAICYSCRPRRSFRSWARATKERTRFYTSDRRKLICFDAEKSILRECASAFRIHTMSRARWNHRLTVGPIFQANGRNSDASDFAALASVKAAGLTDSFVQRMPEPLGATSSASGCAEYLVWIRLAK